MSTSSKGKLGSQFRVSAEQRGSRNRQHFRHHCAPIGGEGGRQVQLPKLLPTQAPQPCPVSPSAKVHTAGADEEQVCRPSSPPPANYFRQCQHSHAGGRRSRAGAAGRRAVSWPLFLSLQEGMFSRNIPSPDLTNSPACT